MAKAKVRRPPERPASALLPWVLNDGEGTLRCDLCGEKGKVSPPLGRPIHDTYADLNWIATYNDNVAGFLQRHSKCEEKNRVPDPER